MKHNTILRYNSARLFVASRTVPDMILPVSLITDIEFGFSIQRNEVKSVGFEEILKPVISNQRPFLSFSYFLSDVDNEKLFRMPVTAEAALLDKIPLFSNMDQFDMFFMSNELGEDFKHFNEDDISTCFFTGASLVSYNFTILKSGLIKVSVTFEADNVLYKKWKDISEYKYIEYDREDIHATNRNVFQINDGIQDVNLGVGGFETQGAIQTFSFSASLPKKILYDFGQLKHRREVQFPVKASINMTALVSEQIEGDLQSILCDDKRTDIIISNSRKLCDRNYIDDKSGFGFFGAELVSQKYSLSVNKGDYFTSNLTFNLDIPRDFREGGTGAFLSQHITREGDIFSGEDTFTDTSGRRRSKPGGAGSVLDIVLEDGSGGKVLLEVAHDMFDQLRDLQDEID